MEASIIGSLFLVLLAALVGGWVARYFKLPPLLGYIVAGIIGGLFLPVKVADIEGLSEVGIILLLFLIGLELSFSKLIKVGYIAILGAIIQMVLVTFLASLFLMVVGFSLQISIILSIGFSLSSTAVVVKILEDRGEIEAIHGRIMIGWLLIQDLAVVPIMALLPSLAVSSERLPSVVLTSLLTSTALVLVVFFLGRAAAPFITRAITGSNSRELIMLGGVGLALGTAFLVSSFGVSAALGAFLAGAVISEIQENHAIFSETRPLRNLFVIIFFVTLGFFITPSILVSYLPQILLIALFVIAIKIAVVFVLMMLFSYRGKTAVATSIGLSQVGEFSFVIFLAAKNSKLISTDLVSVGIATALVTLIATPFLFKSIVPLWRRLRGIKFFYETAHPEIKRMADDYKNHIIICGYGRMGSWIAKALEMAAVPFVIIDYNQKIVKSAQRKGIKAIFGDPAEPSVFERAKIDQAKAVVVAIPDPITQQEAISYLQTAMPKTPIFARAHLNEEFQRLSRLGVKKVIQPELEGALSIVRDIFSFIGRPREEIDTISTRL